MTATNNVNTVAITPTGAGVLKVNGTIVTTGNPSGAIALTVGVNTITVTTQETGKTLKTYTITITRAVSEATATAAVVAAETTPLTQAKVDAAQVLVTALSDDIAPDTTKANLQARIDAVQQNIVNAVASNIGAAFTASGSYNYVVLPTVPDGYTIQVKTSSVQARYTIAGQVQQNGNSNVVYRVEHTASGMVAETGVVVVTVDIMQ